MKYISILLMLISLSVSGIEYKGTFFSKLIVSKKKKKVTYLNCMLQSGNPAQITFVHSKGKATIYIAYADKAVKKKLKYDHAAAKKYIDNIKAEKIATIEAKANLDAATKKAAEMKDQADRQARLAAKEAAETKVFSIKEVAIDKEKFYGKTFVLEGILRLSTNFYEQYRNAETTHYSFLLMNEGTRDYAYLYASKQSDFGQTISKILLKKQSGFAKIQVKMSRSPNKYWVMVDAIKRIELTEKEKLMRVK